MGILAVVFSRSLFKGVMVAGHEMRQPAKAGQVDSLPEE